MLGFASSMVYQLKNFTISQETAHNISLLNIHFFTYLYKSLVEEPLNDLLIRCHYVEV